MQFKGDLILQKLISRSSFAYFNLWQNIIDPISSENITLIFPHNNGRVRNYSGKRINMNKNFI